MDAGVSTVIVSWNTRELLRSCLRSLAEAVASGVTEVIVVDNDSTDGSAEMVEDDFEAVRLIRSGANLGYGRAANLGAAAASGSWLAIANADVEVGGEALADLVRAGSTDRGVGVAAPLLESPDGRRQESTYRFPRLSTTAAAAIGAHRISRRLETRMLRGSTWDPARTQPVDWAIGALLVVRREAFDQVGGFAADQWMYAEDLDLCWRLCAAGWKTLYVPTARVRHVGGAATTPAFGAASGTPEVLGAYYHWLRSRRGAPTMWAYAATALAGAGGRALAYGLTDLAGLSEGRSSRARRWFRLNLRTARTARRSRV